MTNKYTQLKAEWEFKKAVKNRLTPPKNCKSTFQISKCMEDLHFLISEMRMKYDFVPQSASQLFEKYSSQHERLIYEKFIKEKAI